MYTSIPKTLQHILNQPLIQLHGGPKNPLHSLTDVLKVERVRFRLHTPCAYFLKWHKVSSVKVKVHQQLFLIPEYANEDRRRNRQKEIPRKVIRGKTATKGDAEDT